MSNKRSGTPAPKRFRTTPAEWDAYMRDPHFRALIVMQWVKFQFTKTAISSLTGVPVWVIDRVLAEELPPAEHARIHDRNKRHKAGRL